MVKNYIDDKERIEIMLKNIDFCSDFSMNVTDNVFEKNIAIQYTLCMALQIICENANHITEETKLKNKNIPWRDLIQTRNVISHEYGALNLSMVYDTIKSDLPILKEQLMNLLEVLNNDENTKNALISDQNKQLEFNESQVDSNEEYDDEYKPPAPKLKP